jgi:regulatory protein
MTTIDEELNRAVNLGYFFLKFRLRTKKEVNDYLHKKAKKFHLSSDVIEQTVTNLEEKGYIDDKKFIEWFIEERLRNKPKSGFVLKSELRRFGISKDLIDDYFEKHEIDEKEAAYNSLKSRWSRFEKLNPKMRFQKASQFLLRRGFSFEVVRQVIKGLTGKDDIFNCN